jgi:hypothetical protein
MAGPTYNVHKLRQQLNVEVWIGEPGHTRLDNIIDGAAVEALLDALDAASKVLHEFHLWSEDANDGEFAIWSKDEFMAAFHGLQLQINRFTWESADG